MMMSEGASEMESTLKQYFGYSSFRRYQREIIRKIMERRDCLVVMATGSGKSLCYQLPPLIVGKTGIVISPLISLMQDQVMALKQRGVRAEYMASTQADSSVFANAESGHFDLLFMTPEKACTLPMSFWSKLLKAGICLLAVDEAHCISQWGHDFRVEFKQLDKLRRILIDVPFVGLTATATKRVQVDIVDSLNMKDPYVTIGSFDRENLFYGVKYFNRGLPFVDELVKETSDFNARSGSIIIYCTTIKDVEQIFKSLQEAGIKGGMYHGQMDKRAREEAHRLFINDKLQVMVATIAFGMGIDKPDIRCVIHYGCPKNLESYYQESGRCGRDGVPSVCWLYYTRGDFAKGDFYCRDSNSEDQRKSIMESLSTVQEYCLSTTCRRKFLLNYFNDTSASDKCGNCDNCTCERRERDMSREAHLLIACIQSCNGHWGLNMAVDILRGSRAKRILDAQFDKLPYYGLGKEFSSNWWKVLAHQLISRGYLLETVKDVFKFVSVSPKGLHFLSAAKQSHQPKLVLPVTCEMVDDEDKKITLGKFAENRGMADLEREGYSEAEAELYLMLLEDRGKLATGANTAPYVICSDRTIKKIALVRPSTKARLANIDGVNQHILTNYGDHILQRVQCLSERLGLSLDGHATLQTGTTIKENLLFNQQKKVTPAKLEAWKMWDKDGLSMRQIANFPGRSAPIKEQTVFEYILEAAKELAIDWARFCVEVGLTNEIFSMVEGAVTKVGSRDKLKPIKNELPEEVTYCHIKTCLTMLDSGISAQSLRNMSEADDFPRRTLDSSTEILNEGQKVQRLVPNATNCVEKEAISACWAPCSAIEPLEIHNNASSAAKRLRIELEKDSNAEEVTGSTLLRFLEDNNTGVTLSKFLEHFKDSKQDTVVDVLRCLEAEFSIYKKNDLYMLM